MLKIQKFIKDHFDFRERLAEKPYALKIQEDERFRRRIMIILIAQIITLLGAVLYTPKIISAIINSIDLQFPEILMWAVSVTTFITLTFLI